MDFALGQFDVMGLIGKQVAEIRETAKCKKRFTEGPIAAINYIRAVADGNTRDSIENVLMDYEMEEHPYALDWAMERGNLPHHLRTNLPADEQEDVKERIDWAYDYVNNHFLEWFLEQLDNQNGTEEHYGHICHHFKKTEYVAMMDDGRNCISWCVE